MVVLVASSEKYIRLLCLQHSLVICSINVAFPDLLSWDWAERFEYSKNPYTSFQSSYSVIPQSSILSGRNCPGSSFVMI